MPHGVRITPARSGPVVTAVLLAALAAGCQSTDKRPATELPLRPQIRPTPTTGTTPAATSTNPAGGSAAQPTATRSTVTSQRDTSPVLRNEDMPSITTMPSPDKANPNRMVPVPMGTPSIQTSGGSLYPGARPASAGTGSSVPNVDVTPPGPGSVPPVPVPPPDMPAGTKVEPPTPGGMSSTIIPPSPPSNFITPPLPQPAGQGQ